VGKREPKHNVALPNRAREAELWTHGCLRVAGVDEAGVGPLAGPVVAAAVVLPADFDVSGVRDSKLIDEAERSVLERRILGSCLAVGVAEVSVSEIDAIGIYPAGLLAMKRAVESLSPRPDYLLVDARRVEIALPQEGPVRGDRDHTCIAAASIVAKQHRDRVMVGLHHRWPHYGFDEHKGYPTSRHIEALALHGVCPAHRASWLAVREAAGLLAPGYYELLNLVLGATSAQACSDAAERLSAERIRMSEPEYDRLRQLLRRRVSRL
jgi:ribonuclease HII